MSKLSFFQTSVRFQGALSTFEPQNHFVVEPFGTENVPPGSGVLLILFLSLRYPF